MQITADYNMYGKIIYILPEYDTITLNSDFSGNVTMEILVLSEKADELTKKLTDITNGTVSIAETDELYYDFSSVKNISGK
jgi:putative IMPACT (imprinted ancient) family translation regulator